MTTLTKREANGIYLKKKFGYISDGALGVYGEGNTVEEAEENALIYLRAEYGQEIEERLLDRKSADESVSPSVSQSEIDEELMKSLYLCIRECD